MADEALVVDWKIERFTDNDLLVAVRAIRPPLQGFQEVRLVLSNSRAIEMALQIQHDVLKLPDLRKN